MTKKGLIFIEDGSFSFDNRVKRIANALVENGWNITVVCPKYKNDKIFKKVNSNLRILFYPKINASSAFEHLIEHTMSLFLGSFYVLFTAIRYRFKIFHACNPTDILWIIYLPYKLLGVKFIFDQHDLSPEVYLSRPKTIESDLFYKILKWLEKKSYYISTSVLATNQSYKKIAIERGKLNEEKVFIVRNGPLLEKFDTNRILPTRKEPNKIYVGYVGNMNLQDGVEDIVFLCEILVEKYNRTDIQFLLIGGGPNQQNIKSIVIEKGLGKYIKFTGRINDNDMLSSLYGCDFCIQPDPYNPLNNVSTMNKIMEYMALEKAFVAYDLLETKASGADCGLYAKINDIDDMAKKIIRLADDEVLCTRLGKKGRERIETNLEWKYSIPYLLQAYNSVSNS